MIVPFDKRIMSYANCLMPYILFGHYKVRFIAKHLGLRLTDNKQITRNPLSLRDKIRGPSEPVDLSTNEIIPVVCGELFIIVSATKHWMFVLFDFDTGISFSSRNLDQVVI